MNEKLIIKYDVYMYKTYKWLMIKAKMDKKQTLAKTKKSITRNNSKY